MPQLPKSLMTNTDENCGGPVVTLISTMLSVIAVAGIKLTKKEQENIKTGMTIAASQNSMLLMGDLGIPHKYSSPPVVEHKDDAGVGIHVPYLGQVWRDTVTNTDLVLLDACKIIGRMDLWGYVAVPYHQYLKKEYCVPMVFGVLEFHGSINKNGTERFVQTGKYLRV